MMTCVKRMGAAALLVLAWVVPKTASAAGFQETTQSPVATGMANAGVANPNEPNSSYFNPAAMSYRDGFQTYAGLTLIYPTSNYKPFGASDDFKVDTEDNVFPLPHLHVGYAITDDLSAGIGFTAPFGLAVEWPENWVGREVNEFVQIANFNLNPNLSYKFGDTGFSVAGGAQIVYGTVQLNRDIKLTEDRYVQAKLGGDGWGFGGVAALMYRPTDQWTFGAQYRSRVKVDYTNSRIHFSGEENTPFYTTFRDNPGSSDITLPDNIVAGLSYQWRDLFLQFESSYTLWSTFDRIVVDIDTGGDPQAIDRFELEELWENAWAFRLGAQYDIMSVVPVRLGIAYDMTPVPDETVNATLPDNDRIDATIGVGYRWARDWRLDVAYEYVAVMQRDIRNDIGPPGEYHSAGQVLSLGVGYGFE